MPTMFADLTIAPPDPVLGPALRVAADTHPDKVDLGLGIYKDADGRAAILDCVKRAEAHLVASQDTKAYISFAGSDEFCDASVELVLGKSHPALAGNDRRAYALQTPGGTGAVRLAADFFKHVAPTPRVWLPGPTWVNHHAIFNFVGHKTAIYPYYDRATGGISFDAMHAALSGAEKGEVILLHGCCHNPTGADLSRDQWLVMAELFEKTGAIPLIDFAYQGFADGLDEDGWCVRMLAERLPDMAIANSYAKNFALYRERAGALTFVGSDGSAAQKAYGHAIPLARVGYSFPPDHGAAVVAMVLADPELRPLWESELADMRNRLNGTRARFAAALTRASGRDYSFVQRHRGMFSLLEISFDEVERLRQERHIYLDNTGRVNVAGLTDPVIDRVAEAVAGALTRTAQAASKA